MPGESQDILLYAFLFHMPLSKLLETGYIAAVKQIIHL